MLKLLGWAVVIIFLIGLLVVFGVIDLIAAPGDPARQGGVQTEQTLPKEQR